MRTIESTPQAQTPHNSWFVAGSCEINMDAFQALDRELSLHGDPNKTYSQLGSKGLIGLLHENSPYLLATLDENRHNLDVESGFFVIKKTGIDKVQPELAQLGSIALSCLFGNPTQTSPRSPVIAWPITYKPESKSSHKTFSETNSEASFHTDSQYIACPEKYFGLFCVRPDQYGDGVSQVVDGDSVISRIRETHGDTTLEELGKDYPFKLPSVFTKEDIEEEPEVIWAPILDKGQIRYRHDTLMGALDIDGVNIPDSQVEAIRAFENALAETEVVEYSLEAGDAMFINNHRMLHGRTAFKDDKRLLYRVRMG